MGSGVLWGAALIGLTACVDRSPTPNGEYCCPIELVPDSCDCAWIGGSPSASGYCHNICDSAPVGWTLEVDAFGCPIWRYNTTDSCWPLPDAGIDAALDGSSGTQDAAVTDAGSADASADAIAGADGG
jgi:hypothetical protein